MIFDLPYSVIWYQSYCNSRVVSLDLKVNTDATQNYNTEIEKGSSLDLTARCIYNENLILKPKDNGWR